MAKKAPKVETPFVWKPLTICLKYPATPITFTELSEQQQELSAQRPIMSFEEDFSTVNIESDGKNPTYIEIDDIPPLEGSVDEGGFSKGSLCQYIFMSEDEELMIAFLTSPSAVRAGMLRTQEFDDGSRLYFIGFQDTTEATYFYWEMAYEPGLMERVTFNGHRVICGEELISRGSAI